MNTLLILAFVMSLVGFVTSPLTFYKLVFKKNNQGFRE